MSRLGGDSCPCSSHVTIPLVCERILLSMVVSCHIGGLHATFKRMGCQCQPHVSSRPTSPGAPHTEMMLFISYPVSTLSTASTVHNNDHQTLSRFKINFLVFQTPCSDLIFSLFWLRHWICQELKESQSVSVRSFDDR